MSWLILDPPLVRLALAEREPSQGSSERSNVGSCVYFCSPVFGVGCALFAALFGKSSEAGGVWRARIFGVGVGKWRGQVLGRADSKQLFQNAQNAYAEAKAQLNAARANLQQAELNLSYTKVYAPVDGYLTNVNTSPGAYVHVGDQLLALVDSSSFWVAAYFKETQLVSIRPGRTVKMTLMGYLDSPFAGTIESVAWGIFVQDGSGGTSTGLLAAVNQTVDWVRLPQRFAVRIKITGKPPVPLRIGQTITVAVVPDSSQKIAEQP
jgi:multidrug resistance efflux pump